MKNFILKSFLFFGGMAALFPQTLIPTVINSVWLGAVWALGLCMLCVLSNCILKEVSGHIKNDGDWTNAAYKMGYITIGALVSMHFLTAIFLAIATYIFCYKMDTYTGD